jgi:hypothetical protein
LELFDILRLNILSPMVLAFVLGIIAVVIKSDLKIPEQVYTLLTVYLLFAIGLKGGFDLAKSPLSDFFAPAIVAIILGAVIPAVSYALLRGLGRFDHDNAVALGIHFGAVSAVTLSAAVTFLGEIGVSFEGFMPAMYVIMEIPAVIVGLLIANMRPRVPAFAEDTPEGQKQTPFDVLRSALSGKSFVLLGGGVLIGFISGDAGYRSVSPFFVDLFPGMLTLFLLEMGTLVGARLGDVRRMGVFLLGYGMVMPVAHALFALVLSQIAGLSVGGAFIMAILAASASYITAPAIVQLNIPRANPALYLSSALVIVFPFNLIIGLPLYYDIALRMWGG